MDYELIFIVAAILVGVLFVWGHTKAGIAGIVLLLASALWYRREEGVGFWEAVMLLLPVFGYVSWIAVTATKIALGPAPTNRK
ncbi:hypothetical protein [Herbaspirillum huttiense]|uniref:hypothetical protein n=1 Tax=Herbaspirillum huttiense TaxID=863372 RepID=UPI002176AAAB|nr:hypothetical protein [Herbaspirillum huttiense]UWE19381.1 hypothetical protein NY669_26765 [Herbaspirillum huttiense]